LRIKTTRKRLSGQYFEAFTVPFQIGTKSADSLLVQTDLFSLKDSHSFHKQM
jgi:hypothetical protein